MRLDLFDGRDAVLDATTPLVSWLERSVCFERLLATSATGPHPFPSRTRSLSLSAPMVLRSRGRGRVGRRQLPFRIPVAWPLWPRDGRSVKAIGAEVIEVVEGRIKEIRDYHRPLVAEAA